MDLIIYTTSETLSHKQGGDGYEQYYWYLSKPPKNFKEGGKIFFAVKKQIVGSFICDGFYPGHEETLCWNKNSWEDIEPIPCKPFQGFKYKRD